jgi:hypothetical protein
VKSSAASTSQAARNAVSSRPRNGRSRSAAAVSLGPAVLSLPTRSR